MTNLEAYMAYNPNEVTGNLSLGEYGIDVSGTESLNIAAGIGMIDKATAPDYSQGDTSEKMPSSVRQFFLSRGKRILSDNGIDYRGGSSSVEINGMSW